MWLILLNKNLFATKSLFQSVFNIGCWRHKISKSVDISHNVWGRITGWSNMVFNSELASDVSFPW